MKESGLKSTIKTENKASVCHLSGEISYETVIQLRTEFARIRDDNPKSVILDLTGLNELGSAGLGEMARLILWCESKHCQINMVCESDHIREILTISGLEKYSPVHMTLKEALAASK